MAHDFPTTARGEIQWFSLYMEEKLQRNDIKRGWDKAELLYLLHRLEQEVRELKRAIGSPADDRQVIDECADVANFAMMIARNVHSDHYP